jgi:hypothetical protein
MQSLNVYQQPSGRFYDKLRIAERLVENGVFSGWEGSLGPNNQKQKDFTPQQWEK